MINNNIIAVIDRFMNGEKFTINSIYKSDPFEKCFHISTKTKQYKIRISSSQYPKTVQTEFNAFTHLRSYNFKWLPEIYCFHKIDDYTQLLIYDFIEGVSIDKLNILDNNTCSSINSSLVKIISDIHSVENKTFHDFQGNVFTDWSEFLRFKLYKHLGRALVSNLINEHNLNKIKLLFENNTQVLSEVKPRLIHFDIKPANIVYNNNTMTAFLVDFELTRFADTKFDFTKLYSLFQANPPYFQKIGKPILQYFLGKEYALFLSSEIFKIYQFYQLVAFSSVFYNEYKIINKHTEKELNKLLKSI